MSEEEIILYLTHTAEDDFNLEEHQKHNRYLAIQGILDLYNKEKEKNKELEIKLELSKKLYDDACICLVDTVSKDKIKEKIKYIEENYSEHSEFPIGKSIEFLQELLEERN